ncbi:MAG: hypothetical protein E6Q62_10160 [Nitrosomonas sp.]|nr:MAG: hypothetical protein E6Q62_10160 [Nitrosomonas sp.]
MEIKELLKSPQLFVVYAIAILYTITFSLAAVVALPADDATWSPRELQQIANLEADSLDRLQIVRTNSSS